MPYVALYRKYRPKTFSDVVGQDVVVKILKNSIVSNKIGHAYIFSGTRGTGKTSVAKIFSRAINCLSPVDGDTCMSCDVCKNISDNCIDIVEIDAASNNGVEEIREIRNNATLMPTYLKYKVYIIDEVHMLSGSAFNALLKTLEEPPEHIVFILATTELNKIPATVLSRCQKLDFKKIPPKVIGKQLNYILKKEKKKLPDDVIELVSELSEGSFRDAINFVDQLLAYGKEDISVDDVYDLVGDLSQEDIFSLITCMVNSDIKYGLDIINKLYSEGKNFYNVSERLQNSVRDIIINNSIHNYFAKDYEEKLERFSDIDTNKNIEFSNYLFNLTNILKKATNQKTLFETYFIKIALLFNNNSAENTVLSNGSVAENLSNKIEIIGKKEISIEKTDNSYKTIRINNALACADKELKKIFLEKYSEVSDYISNLEYNSISNLMIKATPEVVSDKNILFTFKNNFEVVLFEKNIYLIQKLLKEIYKKKYDIVAVDISEWKEVKNKYINDVKNGIKYTYIKEEEKDKKNKNASALEKEAENIFGDDLVTVE